MLAHLLFDQPYRKMPFMLLEEDEAQLFAESDALIRGDIEAMRCLVRTLLLSGFGTAICGSSHPASQGEHLISHYVDMFGDHALPESFHGEQIGVTARCMPTSSPAKVRVNGKRWMDVVAWAGPWPVDERWWDAASRSRRARFQVTLADGSAHLLTIEGGGFRVEATYD